MAAGKVEHLKTILELRDVTLSIPTPVGDVRPVRSVSLDLTVGETVGLVGESGSGKSMLSRAILGLLPPGASLSPDSRVTFRDLEGRKVRPRLGVDIALVPQDPLTSLNPVRKVGNQLLDGLRVHSGVKRSAARERGRALLDAVGIPEPDRVMALYPHQLSGGMRQRVLIAAAIALRPRVLLADEPTTALDVTVQKQILDLLDELTTEHSMAMILVSHDLSVVAGRSDRVAVMYAGKLVEILPAADLEERSSHPYTRALMASHPRIDGAPDADLLTIEGSPPDPRHLVAGCPFAPRCVNRLPVCETVDPALTPNAAGDRQLACHNPMSPIDVAVRAAPLAVKGASGAPHT
jgi:peptide/nickel transport system ATP-binding protein